MKKRSRNEGSIYKEGERYIVSLSIGYDQDGKRIRKKFSAETKAEAVDILNKQRNRYNDNIELDDTITLGEWAQKCLEIYVAPRVRPLTLKTYESCARNYIYSLPVASTRLGKFRPIQLQAIINACLGAPRTKRLIFEVYRMIFNYAVKEGIIMRSPIQDIALPQRKKRETVIYDKQMIAAMLVKLEPYPMFRLAFLLILLTGIRRSEALGLSWKDVFLNENKIRISHAATIGKTGVILSDPKSEAAHREIIIPEYLTKELRAYRESSKKLEKFVIHNNGKLYHPTDFSAALNRRAEEKVRLHDLRHTFATHIVHCGANIKTLQTVLGHSDIRLTLDTYSHVMDTQKQEVANFAATMV